MTAILCPFCTAPNQNNTYGSLSVDCGVCGSFGFHDDMSYDGYFVGNNRVDDKKIHLLRYNLYKTLQLRKKSHTKSLFKISTDWVETSINTGFPTVAEQLDNLVCLIGEKDGFFTDIKFADYGWKIGSQNKAVFSAILKGAETRQLIDKHPNITLSFEGLQRRDDIMNGRAGHSAFMAMKFGDPELNKVLDECFRPAVADTGFVLQKLDDAPKAGLIDNYMREKIKSSRFLIADLTHSNEGAYWEAGYAEGLGKVVIFTCKNNPKIKRHFDANHHTTIFWDSSNLEEAKKQLKSTIRLSVPEAQKEDIKYAA